MCQYLSYEPTKTKKVLDPLLPTNMCSNERENHLTLLSLFSTVYLRLFIGPIMPDQCVGNPGPDTTWFSVCYSLFLAQKENKQRGSVGLPELLFSSITTQIGLCFLGGTRMCAFLKKILILFQLF